MSDLGNVSNLNSRRSFLANAANGAGMLALASLLRDDGLLAAEATAGAPPDPLAPRLAHFAPKAKACIYIYLEGAPSQIDLFDPKPKLNELNGQPLPESMTKNVRFAFLQKETARLMGCPRTFTKHGECGMELSDFLPHLATCADDICLVRSMHTEAFNHHPGQLLLNTGVADVRPARAWAPGSTTAWVRESKNLPGYVVLTAGRGTSGGTSNWSSGFLPTTYQGVLFRNQGEPVLNLNNPDGVSDEMQRRSIAGLARSQSPAAGRHRRPGNRHPHRLVRTGVPHAVGGSGADRPVGRIAKPRRRCTASDRRDAGNQGHSRRRQGASSKPSHATACWPAGWSNAACASSTSYHASWDHHSNLDVELAHNCQMADQPIAALLKDLKQRGLLDTTLVVWAVGVRPHAAGRKPRRLRRRSTGRDHHPFAFSLWMAGGGIKGGQVIGKTDEIGWGVVEDPIHINDLHATLLHLFGINHLKTVMGKSSSVDRRGESPVRTKCGF